MKDCSWQTRVEAFHDGETHHAAGVAEHLEGCAGCREYLALLNQVSAGVEATRQDVEIADAQFRVFMDGVREGIESKKFAWSGFFSKLSIAMAGFILVVALSYIITAGPVRTWADSLLFSPPVEMHDGAPSKNHAPRNTDDENRATRGDL